jgi:membrane associated rhomboid family serine protease
MVPILNHLDQERANTYSLVLSALGIAHRLVPSPSGYRIDVPASDADTALRAIDRYRSENPISALPADPPRTFRIPLSAIAMALILLCVHLAVVTHGPQSGYVNVFGADARRIVSGELYRCATALLLHADAAHLAGNMVGLILFGGAVCAVTGHGIGWMMILAAGIAGNLVNALIYSGSHLSVGASTAVFGAVGIVCAIRSVDALRRGSGWKRVVVVAGAGVALLAFLGTGPQSDLGAHLFGGLAGMIAGIMYRQLAADPPGSRLQRLAGVVSGAVLVGSWIRGVLG